MLTDLKRPVPNWVSINGDTGQTRVSPPLNTAGQHLSIPVLVTYPDGSTDELAANLTVTARVARSGDLKLSISEKQISSIVGMPLYAPVQIEASLIASNKQIRLEMACKKSDATSVWLGGIGGIEMTPSVKWKIANLDQEMARRASGERIFRLIYSEDGIKAKTQASLTGRFIQAGKYKCAVYATSAPEAPRQMKLDETGQLQG